MAESFSKSQLKLLFTVLRPWLAGGAFLETK